MVEYLKESFELKNRLEQMSVLTDPSFQSKIVNLILWGVPQKLPCIQRSPRSILGKHYGSILQSKNN